MADVFISYARESARQAQAAAAALRLLGYSVWIDDDLPAHRAYARVIEEELSQAKAALVLWSEDATKSEWVRSEANRARTDQKLVQVKLDRIRLPMPFDQIHCADLIGWSGEADNGGWRKAVASIAHLVDAASAPQPEPPRDGRDDRSPPQSATESERRHLTFMACHLVNAGGMAADLDPEAWHDIATQYQAAATSAVVAFGGHATPTSSGVMVYFGYPVAQEDAAERAVHAGLAIVEAMSELNVRLAPSDKVRLAVRIGIHAGTVVVAPRADDHVEMFGIAPSIASFVEAAAAPDTILMTGAVHDVVSGLFAVEDLGARTLEGSAEPMRLYRVIRFGLASGRSRGFAARDLAPFVGRDDEMRLLSSRWERVRDGEGQVVLVSGEPGIGKTRVIEEFRAHIKTDPHLWIEGAGAPLFSNTPFHAVIQMFNQGLGWRGDEDDAERVGRLEAALDPTGLKLGEAVPLIAEMLSLPVSEKYPLLNLAPDQRRVRLLAAMAGWILGATRRQPLVLAMEDLQWVDPSTMELVQTLVEQGATAPLMLLCTGRPEFQPTWRARGHHAHITLNRLSTRETRELVEGIISRAGMAADVVDVIIKRTDGVPLFAEELTRFMLHDDAGANEIPKTLLDSLAARLDRLGPAKEVAQLASVLGREFSYELLEAVASMSEADLQAGLSKLADAELIYARGRPPQATYQFKHALIQDAAYETLLKSRRQGLHARVAQTIAERFAALAEGQPEVLALHWTRAGKAEPATAAWKNAGDAAYARRAFKEAEAAYRQGLAVLDTQPESPERDATELSLCSALNRVLQLTRGYAAPETVEAASRARALAEKSGSLADLIREEARIWRAVITAGDYAGAAALADHIQDLVHDEGDNPGRLVFVHNAQVQVRFYTGDLVGVEAHFERLSPLIDTARQRQAPGNNIVALGIASHTAWTRGRSGVAEQRMARAFAFAEESGNPYDLAMALHFQGNLHVCERDADRAEAVATQLLALAKEHGFSYAAALALSPLGWARAQRGAASEGAALIRRTLAEQVASGATVSITSSLNRLAEAQQRDGATAEALATIEEALTVNPQERVYRSESLRIRGSLRAERGQEDLAETDFGEAMGLARGMNAKAFELRAAVSLADLLRARSKPAAARRLLAPVYAGFTEGRDAPDLQDASALLEQLGA